MLYFQHYVYIVIRIDFLIGCVMLRDGFPRQGGIRDGVEECSFSRLLLKSMGLDVAKMLRPFDPGDCNTAGRGFNSRK